MNRHHQDVLVFAQTQEGGAKQGTPAEIEGPVSLLIREPGCLGVALRVGQMPKIDRRKINVQRGRHGLSGSLSQGDEAGPQDFVAPDNLLQSSPHGRNVKVALETQNTRDVVDRTTWRELVEKP